MRTPIGLQGQTDELLCMRHAYGVLEWIQCKYCFNTGQIQIANGDIAAAEESYQKVIDSDMASTQQKTSALELYIEALQGQDRNKEAAKLQAQLKALQQGP